MISDTDSAFKPYIVLSKTINLNRMNSTYIMQRTHVRIHYVNSFTIDFTKKINEPCQEINSLSSEMKQKKPLNN